MRMDNTLEATIKLLFPIEIDNKSFDTLIIREVVGYDEESISQPSLKNNPVLMLDTLLVRCIAEVPGADRLPSIQEIKKLPVAVIDILTLELRKLTLGEDDIPFTAFCANKECKKPHEDSVSIDDLIKSSDKDFSIKEVTLERGILDKNGNKVYSVKIKPIDGFVQERFSKKKESDYLKFGELSSEFIQACVTRIGDDKPDLEVIRSMTRIDRKKISDSIKEIKGPTLIQECICEYCGEKFEHTINVLDFLA